MAQIGKDGTTMAQFTNSSTLNAAISKARTFGATILINNYEIGIYWRKSSTALTVYGRQDKEHMAELQRDLEEFNTDMALGY